MTRLRGRWRRWLGRLGLLLGATAIGLGAAEITARQLDAHPGSYLFARLGIPAPLMVEDPEIGLVPRPGACFSQGPWGARSEVCFNSLGLRGPEPGPEPAWLVLGDSFTLAEAVARDETFPARLAALRGEPFVNGGVSGWGPWEARGWYGRLAPHLALRGVVYVLFLGNDLQDAAAYAGLRAHARVAPPAVPPPAPSLLRRVTGRSYLVAHLTVRRLRRSVDPDRREAWATELSIFTRAGAQELARLVHRLEPPLAALRDDVRAAGLPLLVAVAPHPLQTDPRIREAAFALGGLDPSNAAVDAPRQAALALLAALSVPACDLLPALDAAAARGADLFLPWDGHWSPGGHAVVADALDRCLDAYPAAGGPAGP